MKTRQLLWLLGALVVFGIIGGVIQWKRVKAWQSGAGVGAKILPDLPLDKIAKVEIVSKDGQVVLYKKKGRWRVAQRYDYPANFQTLSDFLRDLAESKAAQVIEVGPSQYARLHLLPPDTKDDKQKDKTGVNVKFCDDKGKVLTTLRFGKEHQKPSDTGSSWPDGRYILLPNKQVVLVSKTFSAAIDTNPKNWLDKEFFKISDMKTARLMQDGKVLWELKREKKSDDMKLVGLKPGEEQNDSKVRSISTAFSWASFDDVADPSLPPDKTGMDHPKVFVATDFDGFQYTLKIGKKTEDDKYYMAVDVAYVGPRKRTPDKDEKPEDAKKKDEEFKKKLDEKLKKAEEQHERFKNWVYIVSKYTVEDVLKERSDLIKKKEEKKQGKKESARSATEKKKSSGAAAGSGKKTAAPAKKARKAKPSTVKPAPPQQGKAARAAKPADKQAAKPQPPPPPPPPPAAKAAEQKPAPTQKK